LASKRALAQKRLTRAETEPLILEAARALFLERGYERTSMEDIAKRAGVGRQTVFNRFADKESLFTATLAGVFQTVGADPARRRQARNDAEAGLARVGREVLASFASPASIALARTVAAEGSSFPAIIREFDKNIFMKAVDHIATYLRTLHNGPKSMSEARVIAKQYLGMSGVDPIFRPLIGMSPPLGESRRAVIAEQCAKVLVGYYGFEAPEHAPVA
jgi:TetR/AcrR family transcriptional repressor of mexJK operon